MKFMVLVHGAFGGALVATALGLAGCSDDASCASEDDCYAAETCVDGSCVVADAANASNNVNAVNATNVQNSTNGATNGENSTNNINATNSVNSTNGATNSQNATNNVNATNNQNATNNANNQASCRVDLFDSCEDPYEMDPNDSWVDADRPGSSGGCVTERDVIVERAWSVLGKKCHLEAGDWYGQTVVPCDSKVLAATVRVTPMTMCTDDAWALEFNRGGASISCDDERIQCSRDGEDKVIQWLIQPASSVESYYFGVTSDEENVALDYDLTFTIN